MDDRSALKHYFKDKQILVTGGTGSIGQHIVSSLLDCQPKSIVVFNKDDSKQYLMKQRMQRHPNIFFQLGDVRDYQSVEYATRGIDLVFHVAALKQVPVCEEHPFEAVKTNILGSENVIKACILNKVKKVVNISTDKAVNPTNTMGATKLISEKLFNNANTMLNNKGTTFCSVRFGNVINSRGSVIPLFMEQAKSGAPLTITDPKMTRFIMSISDAAQLTLKSIYYSKGGETFIFKMQALSILNLAKTMNDYYQKKGMNMPPIKQIGKRPGEKLYEELIYLNEMEHIVEDADLYVILPEKRENFFHFQPNETPLSRSDEVQMMTDKEIRNLIKTLEQEGA
ncbi:polysaccharide biosynthesis protein [Alteribacter populi]|uniref:polysaccharide biosynthesis protein n=1 Tax=Alteribacter populi TaxID=2011011 RepID=UPI000BBACBDC|nr:polysaccharide biosynthesis protein [Alteribacter populi]